MKQIRTAYDELSTGYRKLLSASDLYDRDTAAPTPHPHPEPETETEVQVSPAKSEADTARYKSSPVRKLAPKAAVLSEEDAFSTNTPLIPQRPTSSKNSRSASRSTLLATTTAVTTEDPAGHSGNVTFLTAEEKEKEADGVSSAPETQPL